MQASNRVAVILNQLRVRDITAISVEQTSMGSTDFKTANDRVTIEMSDGIAVVKLNRADKQNALDEDMLNGIAAAGKFLKTLKGVRVVVITGTGTSFCSGLDLSVLKKLGGAKKNDQDVSIMTLYDERGITHLAQQCVWVWQELDVPVLAAVKGNALGGGCQIVLAADFRFVHPSAKFSLREVHWGIIPDMAGTYLLSRLVRDDIAKDLVMTARVFDGKEANAIGLVTKLTEDPFNDAMVFAKTLASRNPHAVRASKRLLNLRAGYKEQFAAERMEISKLLGTPNQAEAVMAGMQKREPKFVDV